MRDSMPAPLVVLAAIILCVQIAPPLWGQTSPLDPATKAVAEAAARQEVIRDVEKEALALGAPTGFLGTKWLMSAAQVREIRPNARPGSREDSLLEEAVVYGRKAFVHYDFRNDLLLLVSISFKDPSKDEEFFKTQTALDKEHGKPAELSLSKKYRLETKRTIERFIVHHTLREVEGVKVEQIQFYRTPAKR